MAVEETLTLTGLASKIATQAAAIENALKNSGASQPSFNIDAPRGLPNEPLIMLAKFQLQDALHDLSLLVQGSNNYLMNTVLVTKYDVGIINILNEFNFWDAVPLDGTATYSDIASRTGLSESMVKRILRHAFTNRIFTETKPNSGIVVHTATSALPVKEPLLRSALGHMTDEVNRALVNASDSLKKYSDSGHPAESPMGYTFLSKNSPRDRDFFYFLKNDGEGDKKGWRAKRFGECMAHISKNPAVQVSAVRNLFDWGALGSAKIVDVGGSGGHVSLELAQQYPDLTFIVQDLPELEEHFNTVIPSNMRHRISFQAYNFWEPQPVKDADVFLFRKIFHDWSDLYATRILNNTIPSMKPHSRLLVIDVVIPPNGAIPTTAMKMVTSLDLQMFVGCSSRERAAEDWEALALGADDGKRLTLKNIFSRPELADAVIEFQLTG